jgi:uncharacterized Zn finger protein
MQYDAKCPKCGGPAETIHEEVDIGVGAQRFPIGWFCEKCGDLAACPKCGAVEPDHFVWCQELEHGAPPTRK